MSPYACVGDAGMGDYPLTARDRYEGSVPGADDNRFDPEVPVGGSVPGADDAPTDREDRCEGSVTGADEVPFECDDPCDGGGPGAGEVPVDPEVPMDGGGPGADDAPFEPVLPFAAELYEPPVPISATVARATSGRSFLLMFHSFVW
jgi:hypothetical protein